LFLDLLIEFPIDEVFTPYELFYRPGHECLCCVDEAR